MKSAALIVVCFGLAVGGTQAAGPAATPAAGSPSKGATSHPVLIGTWHFTWAETGWEADFTFAADGTFTTSNGGPDGKWKVEKGKIVLEAPNTAQKIMSLPINPSGTKVHDMRKDRDVKAVKLKP
jgi:hypothetical protein